MLMPEDEHAAIEARRDELLVEAKREGERDDQADRREALAADRCLRFSAQRGCADRSERSSRT